MLKYKIKKIIAIALTATMMISASSMPAMVNAATIESSSAVSDNTGVYNGFNYSISSGTASITGYVGSETEIEIPSKIKGYVVNLIGRSAFENSNITKVVIPDSVNLIDRKAFYSCTKLTDVTFPKKLGRIGHSAFRDCTSLTEITLPEGLVYIDRYGFYNTGLKEIIIPNSVKSLGYGVFHDCENLTDITLSDSMEKIEEESFSCLKNLKNIKLPANLKTIGYSAFHGCERLTEIVIPDSVTTIEIAAFRYCEGLTEIVIPEGVTTIDAEAFINCHNLKRIMIPKSVNKIGERAFGYSQTPLVNSDGTPYGFEYNKIEGVTIYTPPKSSAVEYVKKNGVKCVQMPMGDIDLDGKVTIQDATLMQRYCAEYVTLNQIQLNLADADDNGDISIGDATAIQKIVAAN